MNWASRVRGGLGLTVAMTLAGCSSSTGTGGADGGAAGRDGTTDMSAGTNRDAAASERGAAGDSGADVPMDSTSMAGVKVLLPPMGLRTTERGGQAAFAVVLASPPSAGVTISLHSTNPAEGDVSPRMLTFTAVNWDAPQPVTVTGVDDQVQDGNAPYTIVTDPAVSTDSAYGGLNAPDVQVSNIDDESAGVLVIAGADLHTSESGGQATFTVVLTSKPIADVHVPMSSSLPSEGTARPATLTFTPANWDAPQTVTVTGVDDPDPDGPVPYVIHVDPAVSADTTYAGLDGADVALTNVDNDSPGISLNAPLLLVTSERGQQATFTVVLNARPSANVTIAVSSNNSVEATVSPALLTFTPANWNAPQVVTLTGLDDPVADGNQTYNAVLAPSASTDPSYANIDASDPVATNIDDDSPGITVESPVAARTTEMGGQTTFTVVLNSKPVASVVVPLASSDVAEGTVSPASLTFTPDNYNAPQTVTVKGVDDDVADGNQTYGVHVGPATGGDPRYAGLTASDVALTNTDNDSAGITIESSSNLTTTEGGGQTTFIVVLNSRPTGAVTIGIVSRNTLEGTVSPPALVFGPDDWNARRAVTVTGVNDDFADGNQIFTIAMGPAASNDAGYQGLAADNVIITNTDNDSAGITVTGNDVTTTEALTSDTFTVVLNSEPLGDVTLGFTSSDPTEGTVSPSSLTFTRVNWNAPRTITVTGVDDDVADGNQVFTILTTAATSSDPQYNNVDPLNVSVSNTDDDSAGITVTGNNLTTTEGVTSDTFTIRLNSEPTADVTIAFTSSDLTEGTVSPASVTFTHLDWNGPRTITVTGVNDNVADHDQPYSVVIASAASGDSTYNNVDAPDVSVTNTDNDSAGVTVTGNDLTTTEGLISDTFTIVLNSEPTADVTIAFTSSDLTEGTVSPASVTFTHLDWNAPRTVTVTGVNDNVADNNQPYSVVIAASTGGDTSYNSIDPPDVSVTNTDNDSAGITITGDDLTTTEALTSDTFTVVLNSEPTADVTIGFTSNDLTEGAVSPASITFTHLDWNSPRTITATGVDDDVADNNQSYTIITAPSTSGDSSYNNINLRDVAVSNTDNDSASITVTGSDLTTTEGLTSDTFTIKLNSEPTADVTIGFTSNDLTEGTVSPASVTFTHLDWNAPQTITVTGVNDDVADNNQPYSVVIAASSSLDPKYNSINPADVSVTNTDNDSAGITITGDNLTTTEGLTSDTFTVVLNSEPTADVTIGFTSNDLTEGTVSPASVTFGNLDWSSPRTITVTGVNDFVADNSQPYTIITAPSSSADAKYNSINIRDVSVSNTDDDSAGITVTGNNLTTTEGLTSDTFTVVLNSEPTADVTIGFTSSDLTEGTVSPANVTFTHLDWNGPRTITVTGANDFVADNNQPYSVVIAASTSADTKYNNINPSDVSVTNNDNDSAGITVTGNNLTTTEGLGTDSFTIVLNSEPTADVTIGFTSNDLTEGTVSPASVTFTNLDWNSARTITVTGVNDFVADNGVDYTIVTAPSSSLDSKYSNINPPDVSVTNTDDDTAGITVTGDNLITTEGLGTDAFTIVLNSQPTADVTIGFTSSDLTEGTVAPASVTFTSEDWSSARTITATGVNDVIIDNNQPYTIVIGASTSGDRNYNNINPTDVSVTNNDNDSAGITVTADKELTTTEAGGTVTFTVVLNSQPSAGVSVGFTSNDLTEGTVSPASVTFTSSDWDVARTVTVTGVPDAIADHDQSYTIVTAPSTSVDTNYNDINPTDVSVTNIDDDVAGITVTGNNLTTTESGGTGTFTIVLNSQPTADVTIGISSDDVTEGTASPGSVTFTSVTWSMAQTITVTGVPDAVTDGNVVYHIVTAAASSADGGYNTFNPSDVTVTNNDVVVVGCPGTPACNGHGSCSSTTCTCTTGFTGAACDSCASGYFGYPTCILPDVRLFDSGSTNGAFGGRSGADSRCSLARPVWAIGKTVRAFISASATDTLANLPSNYALPSTHPVSDITGANLIGNDWADLFDNFINMSFSSAGITSSIFWTASNGAGAYVPGVGQNCVNWSSSSTTRNGVTGDPAVSFFYLLVANTRCDFVTPHLLCVAY